MTENHLKPPPGFEKKTTGLFSWLFPEENVEFSEKKDPEAHKLVDLIVDDSTSPTNTTSPTNNTSPTTINKSKQIWNPSIGKWERTTDGGRSKRKYRQKKSKKKSKSRRKKSRGKKK